VKDWRRTAIRLRLARKVYELRVERGLTQYQLAERAEMHRPIVSRIERGVHRMGLGTLQRMAAALDVPAKVLLAEVDIVNYFWERAQRPNARVKVRA
jgi:transcriptional regulator with XRE-family HTH domain